MSTAAVNIDEKCAPDGPVLTELNRSMDGLPVPFLVNRPIIEAYWEVLERIQDKIKSSLCFFDRGVFLEMGADVARMLQDSTYRSHFLR